jgi:flagellar biosynthesis protein FlhB
MDDKLIPNRETLRVLRLQGKVSWSRHATRACITLAVVAYLMSFGAHYAQEVWALLQTILGDRRVEPDALGALMRGVGEIVVATSLIALVVGLLVSLVQTGLFVSIQAVRPMFRRWRAPHATVISAFLPLLGIALGGGLFVRYIRDTLLVLRQPQQQVFSSVARVASDFGKTVIVVALVFAILSFVATRLSFLWRHRMTKREMIGQLQK